MNAAFLPWGELSHFDRSERLLQRATVQQVRSATEEETSGYHTQLENRYWRRGRRAYC